MAKRGPSRRRVKRPTRRGLDRARLFAVSWLANGRNGTEAARTAGYLGTAASLAVTASRLLNTAKVREFLDRHVQQAERAMGASEAVERLSDIARLPDTELADMADFITLIPPEEARGVKGAKRRDPARPAGCGFYIDLDKALKRGKTRLIKELSHDGEAGAPGIKLQDNLAVYALAMEALRALAKIYGLSKGTPPPEPPKVELWRLLELLPNDVLLPMKNALVQAKQQQALVDAREKAQALPAEARPVA